MKTLIIDNIEIEVQKKKIKNLYLSVSAPLGKVRLSVPQQMNDDTITAFIMKKIPWIRKQQGKFKNQSRHLKHAYVSGESVYLWGKPYCLEVIPSHRRANVQIKDDRLLLTVQATSTVAQRANILNAWYRKMIKKEIPPLIEKWQQIMGVTIADWGVKNMKTRWGTCNVRARRIWLNLQLAQKHPRCLEYVIVHELVHLLEKNHNKIFAMHMDQFLPGWKTVKNEMNGRILD